MSNINITSSTPELKLEAGKRYWTRYGWVTPPLNSLANEIYCFNVRFSEMSWTKEGRKNEGVFSGDDLVSEYHEPSPAQWTLCKDRMPTEADGFQGSRDLSDNGHVAWWTHSESGIVWLRWDNTPDNAIAWLAFPPFIAPPEPPARVFLDMEDVPPGSVIRRKDSKHGWNSIQRVDCDGIYRVDEDGVINQLQWNQLADYEISTDGGKTWGDCSKVRTAEEEA